MKDLKKVNTIAMYILAGLITVGFFSIIYILMWAEIPQSNKDLVTMAIGALVGSFSGGVVGYFFGSSKGSAEKTELMNKDSNLTQP
jgi:membrane protein YqaA with SNARE-associated domain